VLDAAGRFITSADCELTTGADAAAWRGALSGIEPNARLSSGRHRIRTRAGVEATITIQARQRIGERERYPFVGEGQAPALESG
jgi:hypothetical protein